MATNGATNPAAALPPQVIAIARPRLALKARVIAAISSRANARESGNVRSMADVKLASLGLTRHLDLDAGAYGTESEIRADLVPVAQRHAAARYGEDFSGARTVLVGDTPLDVEAALVAGARAVGVATGGFSAEDLAEAGAHAVLDDLSDTALALRAILGHP